MRLVCDSSIIETTLMHLRNAGRNRCECVVLWLGKRDVESIRITEAYRPLQTAQADMFHIPREGMAELHGKLRQNRVMVAAQIHSHPFQAFHSKADDRWAIVRHENALSLVVPNFASETTLHNFLTQTKIFRFSATAIWTEVPAYEVPRSWLQIL